MKKLISIALALLMIAVMLPVMAMAEGANVAKIGNMEYATLKEAFDAVQDGETIVVMKNCSGDGIVVNSGKNFTVDFNNCTYNIDGTTVGSTGTETNGFQLLKDSTITFKNGNLTSTKAKILIQNYCNLTLENMELDGRNLNRSNPNYTLSNNNGNVVIDGTNISAADGMVAFDVCRYADYTGPSVTVQGNSVINGKVEISSSAPKDGAQHRLIISGGTFNGPIVKDGNNPDFLSDISGGVFVSDIVPFTGNSAFVVKDNNTGLYYAGGDAETVISEAESGSFTVLTNYHSELTVNPGVSITNGMPEGTFTVNGQVLNPGETHPTPSDGSSVTVRVPETISGDGAKNPTTGASSTGNVAVATAVVLLVSAAVVIRKK